MVLVNQSKSDVLSCPPPIHNNGAIYAFLTGVWCCPDLCSFSNPDKYHVCEDTNWTQALSFRWHRFCCCWWCWRVKVSQPIRDSRVSEAGRANLRNKTDRSCLWRRHLQWRQQELRFVPPVGFLCNLNNSNRALYTNFLDVHFWFGSNDSFMEF